MEPIGIRPGLRQNLGQHMLLLPRMLQSIEVLELPSEELDLWLRRAAEENEALRLVEPRRETPQPPRSLERSRGTREASQRHDEFLQNQPDRERGMAEQLEEQLALLELEPRIVPWVRLLIGCIDGNGYLSLDDAALLALARERGLDGGEDALAQAFSVLHTLEPRGIGARNAIEALLLQLDRDDPQYEKLRALLEDFLADVAKNKLPAVARAMGLRMEELHRLIARLSELDPRPGAQLSSESSPRITPDVVVERTGETFEVRVESSALPSVRVDPRVAALARDRAQPREVKSYLGPKLESARWIVQAVEQRRRTLARLAGALFERQKAFLERGPGHLVPLRMRELAAELGIHVSTVSRAVGGKSAQTPWGILPLRHFFQASAGADEESARDDVREAVRAIFAAEDRTRPLSDDEVVEAMAARGWTLARRTIAKYRCELSIPSSYRRRVY